MRSPVFYMVKLWVSPEESKRFVDWLDGTHIREVFHQQGFLWARRCRLEGPDGKGFIGHFLVFGVDSLDSLKRYFDSTAGGHLLEETKKFKDVRIERLNGTLDRELAAPGRTGNEEPKILFFSRAWVAPEGHKGYFGWLDGGHLAEVIRMSGFQWLQRVHLDGRDENGWERYINIYGQTSLETVREFLNDPAGKRFAREAEPYAKYTRRETFFGVVELALDSK